MYTFNSARYFSVFIGIALVVFTFSSIKKQSKLFLLGIIIACIFVFPVVPHMLSKEARLRFVEVNIFTDSSVVKTANERIAREGNTWFAKVINNRRVGYARSYILHFLDNVQPDFLFVHGDGNPKFSTQDVGQMYLIEAPFLAIGIITMFATYPSIALLLLYWIVVSIVPAATARETPHALRILNSLPTWQILVAYGILTTFQYTRNIRSKKFNFPMAFCLLLIVLFTFNLTYYLHNYYRHYPVEFSGEWQYGYKQALAYVGEKGSQFNKIYISENIGRPYMYTLFYTKYDPQMYRQSKKSYFDSAGFYHVDAFGKFVFTRGEPSALENDALYIYPVSQSAESIVVRKTIRLLNGDPVLFIYTKG